MTDADSVLPAPPRNGSSMSTGVRWALGVVVALGSSGLLAGGGMMLLLFATFAFDSPLRKTDPETVMKFLLLGLGTLQLGRWTLSAAIPIARWRKGLLIVGGLIAVGGVASVCIALGLALFGG